MASNNNELTKSYVVYKPPHLRSGLVDATIFSSNNNDSKYMGNNSKEYNNVKSTKYGIFSKYTVPAKQKQYDLGTSNYFDHKFKGTYVDYKEKIEKSSTLYVGNLNLMSTESDIHKLFSKAGYVKNIIMGLDKKTLSPGGFCFVEYATRVEAEYFKNNMQDTLLDGKKLFIDWDAGFIEGRQYIRKHKVRSKCLEAIKPNLISYVTYIINDFTHKNHLPLPFGEEISSMDE